jgi:hypothetical protein
LDNHWKYQVFVSLAEFEAFEPFVSFDKTGGKQAPDAPLEQRIRGSRNAADIMHMPSRGGTRTHRALT